MNDLRNVSSSPHVRAQESSADLMRWVLIALLPASLFGIWHFGPKALFLIVLTVLVCVAAEFLYEKGMHKPVTITDGSAAVTGLLLALNLPVSAPWWLAVLGGVFAIVVVKQLFGGLGQNFMNPALAARCFLLISFAARMTDFTYDAVSGATPLAAMRAGESVDLVSMFVGTTAGTIGETSVIAILEKSHQYKDSGHLSAHIRDFYCAVRRSRTGSVLSCGSGLRRRTDAGSLVYGYRLCDKSDHAGRSDRIRRLPGPIDRRVPLFRRFGGRSFLCDYSFQPSGASD